MHERYPRRQSGGGWFNGLLMGGLIGAAIALLTTKHTGEENRRIIQEKREELMGRAQEYRDKAVDAAYTTRDRANELAGQAREKVSQVADTVSGKASQIKQEVRRDVHDAEHHIDETKQELRRENEIMEDMQNKNYDL